MKIINFFDYYIESGREWGLSTDHLRINCLPIWTNIFFLSKIRGDKILIITLNIYRPKVKKISLSLKCGEFKSIINGGGAFFSKKCYYMYSEFSRGFFTFQKRKSFFEGEKNSSPPTTTQQKTTTIDGVFLINQFIFWDIVFLSLVLKQELRARTHTKPKISPPAKDNSGKNTIESNTPAILYPFNTHEILFKDRYIKWRVRAVFY